MGLRIQIFEAEDSITLQDQINDWIKMYEDDVHIQEIKTAFYQGIYMGTIQYEEDF